MPSDALTRTVLDALAPATARYRSAVAAAADEVAALLAERRTPTNGRAERVAHELGAFAGARIDSDRFAALFASAPAADAETLARLERAHHALRHVVGRGDTLFHVSVPSGRDLAAYVADAIGEIGRAFGAARAFELARQGRAAEDDLEGYIGGFAFRRWNRAEREIAPALVVEVDGADAHAGGLAEFLNGQQKLVLVIRGDCPAALLARLVTPGVYVTQTADAADLAELARSDGPAIAALVPESAARFVHRPGTTSIGKRLEVRHMPAAAPKAPIGRYTAFQQIEELAVLKEWAAGPLPTPQPSPPASGGRGSEPSPAADAAPAAAVSPAPAPAADPAGKLAAWLLGQADLGGA
jgi:hypothetical protein